MNKSIKTIILGGGLSGLTLAMLLEEAEEEYLLIEARNRLGGRILTLNEKDKTPLEMGATWFGKKHHNMVNLLRKTKTSSFPQFLGKTAIYEPISTSPHQLVNLPSNDEPSFRISNGSSSLIESLAEAIHPDKIKLNHIVRKLDFTGKKVIIETNNGNFEGDNVVSTIPPYLLWKTISFTPALPNNIVQIMQKTHTWMGESIKIGLRYEAPFWQKNQKSGTIFSNVGPVPEMYDHSNEEDNGFALVGFLNSTYFSISEDQRKKMTLNQLEKYYGKVIHNYLDYKEKVWIKDEFTYAPYSEHILPHENNGNPILRNKYMGGRLILAGSESAASYPGYMDGAIESAYHAFHAIIK